MRARALLAAGLLALLAGGCGASERIVVTRAPLRIHSVRMDVEWKPRYGVPIRVPALILEDGIARDPETMEPLTAGLGAGVVTR